jgi:hypothetical protein
MSHSKLLENKDFSAYDTSERQILKCVRTLHSFHHVTNAF